MNDAFEENIIINYLFFDRIHIHTITKNQKMEIINAIKLANLALETWNIQQIIFQ